MAIIINLDLMLAKRKMRLERLARLVGISSNNLSIIKTNKSKAIRYKTLAAICKALNCKVEDLLEYRE